MNRAKAEFLARFLNDRMDRSNTPLVSANMILAALEDYRCLAHMVNGYRPTLIEQSIKKARTQ